MTMTIAMTMTGDHPDHDQIQMQCSALAVEMSEARHHPSTGKDQLEFSAARCGAAQRHGGTERGCGLHTQHDLFIWGAAACGPSSLSKKGSSEDGAEWRR
jgi:hypothetical protein